MTDQLREHAWFIVRDGQQHGPVPDHEMHSMVARGVLKPSDMVWRDGLSEWQPLHRTFKLPPPLPPSISPSQGTRIDQTGEKDRITVRGWLNVKGWLKKWRPLVVAAGAVFFLAILVIDSLAWSGKLLQLACVHVPGTWRESLPCSKPSEQQVAAVVDPMELIARRGYTPDHTSLQRATALKRTGDVELLLKVGATWRDHPIKLVHVPRDIWDLSLKYNAVPATTCGPTADDKMLWEHVGLLHNAATHNNVDIYRSLCAGKHVDALRQFATTKVVGAKSDIYDGFLKLISRTIDGGIPAASPPSRETTSQPVPSDPFRSILEGRRPP